MLLMLAQIAPLNFIAYNPIPPVAHAPAAPAAAPLNFIAYYPDPPAQPLALVPPVQPLAPVPPANAVSKAVICFV